MNNIRREPAPLTVAGVRAEAQKLGFSFRTVVGTGEYRIVPKGKREDSAYYTNDLTDALQTMRAWR